jgi:DNA integrity scanning protein DisA with diadenylate cyclase activity
MKPVKLRENSAIDLSLKNLISIIIFVAISVYVYFGMTEKLNNHSTKLLMIEKDLEKVVEFSIKYPRGEMGMSANDQEQNILIEFQQKIIEKLQEDVEKLKDKQRNFTNGNNN